MAFSYHKHHRIAINFTQNWDVLSLTFPVRRDPPQRNGPRHTCRFKLFASRHHLQISHEILNETSSLARGLWKNIPMHILDYKFIFWGYIGLQMKGLNHTGCILGFQWGTAVRAHAEIAAGLLPDTDPSQYEAAVGKIDDPVPNHRDVSSIRNCSCRWCYRLDKDILYAKSQRVNWLKKCN